MTGSRRGVPFGTLGGVLRASLLVLLAAACSPPSATPPEGDEAVGEVGVIVVEALPGWAGDRAGIVAGDRIVGWERASGPAEAPVAGTASAPASSGASSPTSSPASSPAAATDPATSDPRSGPAASGSVSSPYDLVLVEEEEGPRGSVVLRVVSAPAPGRDGSERRVALPAGAWRLVVRPPLSAEDRVLFAAARRAESAEAEADPAPSSPPAPAARPAAGDSPPQAAPAAATPPEAAAQPVDAAPAPRPEAPGGDAGRTAEGGATAGRPSGAAGLYLRLADRLAAAGRPVDAAWFRSHAVAVFAGDARWEEARAAHAAAAETLAGDPTRLATAEELAGFALSDRSHADVARDLLERALAQRRRDGHSLAEAALLSELARLAAFRGRMDEARQLVQEALEIRHRLAPGSPAEAQAITGRAIVAAMTGDPQAAEDGFRQALEMLRRAAPGSPELASAENNLGLTARRRGDLPAAEAHLQASLAILETADPDGERMAETLNNLGIVARTRGRLDEAEGYWRRALDIRRRRAPESLELARSLGNLGNLAYYQGHLERAESIARETLALVEVAAPGSLQHLKNLHTLGNVVRDRGDLEEAAALYGRARELAAGQGPRSNLAAGLTVALADLALRRGDLEAAARFADDGIARFRAIAPASLDEAEAVALRATVDEARGDLETAARRHRRALEVRSAQAPGSAAEVDSLAALGRIARQRGERQEAASLYREAVDALETQRAHLGGTEEVRSRFSEHYAPLYQAYLELLVDAEAEEEAFHVLERFRAQSLRALLREREVSLDDDGDSADGDGEAGEEVREEARRRLRREHEAARAELARLESPGSGATAAERARARRHLEDLQLRREEVRREELRRRNREPASGAAARRAALAAPSALDAATVASRLPAGTVLLSYAVGESSSLLFVVEGGAGAGTDAGAAAEDAAATASPAPRGGAPGVVHAHRLPVGRQELDERVAAYRRLLQDPAPSPASTTALAEVGRALAEPLLGPVAERLEKADAVLVIPDRPLHALPFSALPWPRPASGASGPRPPFVVEKVAVHTAASASVWDRLRGRSGVESRTGTALLALGDPERRPAAPRARLRQPLAGTGAPAAAATASAVAPPPRRGPSLPPLPHARQEVRAVAERFGDGARVLVGREATEARLERLADGVRYLHLACHASADERFPLDSFLALALPAAGEAPRAGGGAAGGERGAAEDAGAAAGADGLLRAWEVLEDLRLSGTELVTLSACDSALGAEIGGEGMLGLTHAFHYAGARTVLASLWPVSDRSTAVLMDRVYAHLAAGEPAHRALRAAQVELLTAPVEASAATAEPGFLARWLPFLAPEPEPVLLDARAPFHWAAFQLHGGV